MTITPAPQRFEQAAPAQPGNAVNVDPALGRQYAALYGPVSGERFPIPAVRLSDIKLRISAHRPSFTRHTSSPARSLSIRKTTSSI